MASYFIDPGYGKNWSVVGDTGTISRVESEEYNPYCGVAFTGLKSQGAEFCALQFNSESGTWRTPLNDSLYGLSYTVYKFSVYLDLSPSEYFCVGFNSAENPTEKIHYVKFDADGYTIVLPRQNGTVNETRHEGSTKGFHNVWLRLNLQQSPSTTTPRYSRIITISIDGSGLVQSSLADTTADLTATHNSWFLHFCTEKANACYVSNILRSYTSGAGETIKDIGLSIDFSFDMKLVPLGLNVATESTFIAGENGEYIGNTRGQQLLSTIDAQNVIEKFGATSKVSHLVSYGNPGYTTSSNITTAYGRFEVGGEIVDGTGRSITTDPDATIYDIKEMTDTTLADVDGKKIGWRV